MLKTILKETGIILLLLIAISLVFVILFYDYVPNNKSKTIPAEVEAYKLPDDVKEELGKTLKEGQNIVRTYYIDSTDLNLYEATQEYNKGKANPFASSKTTSTNTTSTTNNGSNAKSSTSITSSSSNTQNVNTTSNTDTSEDFLNNKTGKY